MADNFTPVQAQKFRLSGSGCTSSATSIILQSMTLPDGSTTIAMSDLGDIGFITLEPGTSREEQISFTGITQNADGTATLTGCLRGLRFVAPFDEVAANKKAHAGGTIAILSNTAAFYDQLTAKDNDETITGIHTFTETAMPRITAAHTYGAGEEEYLATKRYADSVALVSAPDASTTAKGVVEEATQAQVDAGTTTGETGARLFQNPTTIRAKQMHDYAVDSVGTDSYAVTVTPTPAALSAGDVFVFKAGTKNTGAATLAVNGGSAISIVKEAGAPLVDGDILANQVVVVVYDASGNFQMISQGSTSSGDAFGDGSDGDVTVNSGTFTSGPITSNALTRDAYFRNLTIQSTRTLSTAGYRLFVRDTLQVDGTLSRIGTNGTNGSNGTAASGGTKGTGGGAGTGGAALSAGTLSGALAGKDGKAGGDGADGTQSSNAPGNPGSASAAANAGANASNSLVTNNGAAGTAGGAGGAGGAGAVGAGGSATGGTAGGAGGTTTASTIIPRNIVQGVLLYDADNTTKLGTGASSGGSTGGSGGSSGGTNGSGSAMSGGGGGGGGAGGNGGNGGLLAVFAQYISIGATGVVTAAGGVGGNGGNGNNGGNGASGAGGGGTGGGGAGGDGGTGGSIVYFYQRLDNAGSITVAGGAGGTKGTKGATVGTSAGGGGLSGSLGSDGTDGATGNSGTTLAIQV